MKRILSLAIIMLIVGMFAVPNYVLGAPLDEVKSIVSKDYKGDIPSNLESMTTIDAIMKQLDPYSTYFTKEAFDNYRNSINHTTTGIGVVLEEHGNGIQIVNTFEGGTAHKAGITPGDIILSVDGVSTKSMSVQQASSLITGKEGTVVVLEVLKITNKRVTVNLTRKQFSLPVVTKKLLFGNVGYIALHTFSDDGAVLVQQAKSALQKQGATSFILDLTNNGGGYVFTAEELIGLFPASPYAYYLHMRGESGLVKSVRQSSFFPKNTKVLINGYSASASEMTAAALLDQKSAILYGQKTYGKGSMQTFYRLSDGSYLKLTVAHFTGPKGTIIQQTGVKPNVVTKSGKELEVAHLAAILEANNMYKKLAALTNVPTTKQFTVTFTNAVVDNKQQKNIELVKLGGGSKIPVTIKRKLPKQLVVIPNAPLEKGASYVLLIHPTFQTEKGKTMQKGAYVNITVQP